VWVDDISVEAVTDLPSGASIINLYSAQAADVNTESSGGSKSWMIILALLFVAAIGTVVFFVTRKPSDTKKSTTGSMDTSKSKDNANQKPHAPAFKIDRKDLITMGAMTLIYLIIALINLEAQKCPKLSEAIHTRRRCDSKV
jgi:putative exporter of polyketide antibiotics